MNANNTIATFPYPTLSYDCLKANLDAKIVKDVDSKVWALNEPGVMGGEVIGDRFIGPKDEYVNDLSATALRGIGAATAKALTQNGVTSVRDFAYADRDAVTSLFGGARGEALGKLHDAMRVCVGGDVWIQ